jgi:hypothetical protein
VNPFKACLVRRNVLGTKDVPIPELHFFADLEKHRNRTLIRWSVDFALRFFRLFSVILFFFYFLIVYWFAFLFFAFLLLCFY